MIEVVTKYDAVNSDHGYVKTRNRTKQRATNHTCDDSSKNRGHCFARPSLEATELHPGLTHRFAEIAG